jgi:hypothetical protein
VGPGRWRRRFRPPGFSSGGFIAGGAGVTIVPEPSSLVLLAKALPVVSYVLRRRGFAGR